MGKDYYQILGIPRTASPEETRNAYLKLAKEWHPDINKSPDAKERFQDIAEAFEILKHPTRKKIYDQGGEEALTAGGKRTTTGPMLSGQNKGIPPNSANRLAAQFFGYGIWGLDPSGAPLGGNNVPTRMGIPGFNLTGFTNGETTISPNGIKTTTFARTQTRSKPPAPKKRSVLLALECTLSELFTGCTKTVKWDAYEDNEHISKEVSIKVQPGWSVGHKIEIQDTKDEVTIIVTETAHQFFRRKKEDLHYSCNISLEQALCGTGIVIPTIKGKNLKLSFSKIISSGYVYEIPGQGMPIEKSLERGKLIVTFTVVIPAITDDKRQRIIEILRE